MIRHPIIVATAVCLLACPARAFDPVIDSPMYKAPDVPAGRVEFVFPEEAKALWLKALGRPEADLKCRAAEAIIRAHGRGVKGLEASVPALVEALERAEQQPLVRVAVSRALVALEARDAAPALFRLAQSGGSDLRDVVEPALARWDYRPARAVWLARLEEPTTAPRGLVLAVQGLGAVREGQAADRLQEMVRSDRVAGPLRREAARALGSLRAEGLEKDAERLAADSSPRGLAARLAAVALLRRHEGEAAARLLRRLAEDPEPAVAALAVARLLELDSKLAVPLVERLLASPDARLRSLGIEVVRRHPGEDHVRLLGGRLDDPDPEVHTQARRALYELAADKGFRKEVIDRATGVLGGRGWQGWEQATILLVQLDHKPAARRLLDLLRSDRPEAAIAAAWGLRRLAVADTLPEVVRYLGERQRELRAAAAHPDATTVLLDHQLSQLNQFLGQQKYAPADAVLREFIPRMEKPMSTPTGYESRAAAIWALGLIHQGKAPADLATAVEGRLNDVGTMPPEDIRVRRMCAIALARLGAKAAVPSLRAYFLDQAPSLDPVNNACGWAIEQLTGEALPAPKNIRKVQRDWFLSPSE